MSATISPMIIDAMISTDSGIFFGIIIVAYIVALAAVVSILCVGAKLAEQKKSPFIVPVTQVRGYDIAHIVLDRSCINASSLSGRGHADIPVVHDYKQNYSVVGGVVSVVAVIIDIGGVVARLPCRPSSRWLLSQAPF